MKSTDDADVPASTGPSLIEAFARHRVAANLLMIMMILAGAWGVAHIHTQLNPPQTPPEVWVDVTWPGASAEDVEGRVTIPVEQALRGLRDMRELHSRSRPGRSSVWVEFEFDADLPAALDRVKQAVANIRNLPSAIEPPQIRLGYSQELVASVLLTGPGQLEELIPLAREFERDLLARGIEAIEIDGLPEQELRIMVASRTLTAAGTTLGDLATEVRRLSADVPAGTVGRAQGPRALRSLDQQRSVRGFEGLFVAFGGDLVRLGDLAEIDVQSRDDAIEVTHGGQPAIELYLMRTGDGDALHMAEVMNAWLDEVRPSLPEGVQLHVMKEAWSWIAEQLSVLLANGLSGLLLVMAVLLVFLSGRVAAWVAVGIPVSFALALAIYWGAFDGRIQIVSLIAFIMALGIVVDDAIVVSEDAVTQYEGGKSPREAAIAGARRMFVPVMTSSLTTLAAFAPLILFGGPMGEAIIALPTVLLCIILASLIECFLVLPHHLAGSLERSKRGEESRFRRAVDARFDAFRERVFRPVLQRALAWPGATVCTALAAVLVAFALVASQRVGVNFITNLDMESVEAAVQFAGGTSETRRNAFLEEIETALAETRDELGEENIIGWTTKTNYTRIEQERRYGPEYAWIDAEYAPEKARTAAPQAFVDTWRERIEVPPWVEVFELRTGGGSNGGNADLTLRLRGRDATDLKSAAIELAEVLRGYEGVTNVTDDMPWGREQWIFVLGPAGRAAGLTPDELGRQLRSAYSGERVQIFNRADEELEVRVMLPEIERSDLASLRRFPVRLPDGAMVPLGSVARLEARRGIDEIRRMDGELAVRVHAWVDPGAGNAFEITGDVRERHLPGIEQRWDVVSGLSGQSEQDAMMMQTFAAGFLLTFVFIYLILAWVFSSWTWPVAIMTAIPFGLTGAIFGHWVMGMDFGVMSILAFFALTGVVVNDSIVLTSFLRRHHDEGMPFREALELAATQRLRAVMMTSLTTCAGLAPLMFEPSSLALYIAPIAITIVFGLAFATALVLLVVPALLLLVDSGTNGLRHAAIATKDRLIERLLAGASAPGTAARMTTNDSTTGGTR
ncbi:MAG: efflux RND transporter permease subunit [Pseudomonadales bacterium]|jgi:multidrug efflux pump subunit AcrB|nr:efflux RND transporter permease subunit [Pseudomonadales bacterium]